MNVKLLVGIVVFVFGIAVAAMGIGGVVRPDGPSLPVEADYNRSALESAFAAVGVPVIAGLSLALGGVLIGLSMGNWKHPRTHIEPGDEVVDPEGYHKMKHV